MRGRVGAPAGGAGKSGGGGVAGCFYTDTPKDVLEAISRGRTRKAPPRATTHWQPLHRPAQGRIWSDFPRTHPPSIPSSSSAVAASTQASPRAYLELFPADAPTKHPLEQQRSASLYTGKPNGVFGAISRGRTHQAPLRAAAQWQPLHKQAQERIWSDFPRMHPQGIPSSSNALAASTLISPRTYLERFPADAPARHSLEQQRSGSLYTGRPKGVFETISRGRTRRAPPRAAKRWQLLHWQARGRFWNDFLPIYSQGTPSKQQRTGSLYTDR